MARSLCDARAKRPLDAPNTQTLRISVNLRTATRRKNTLRLHLSLLAGELSGAQLRSATPSGLLEDIREIHWGVGINAGSGDFATEANPRASRLSPVHWSEPWFRVLRFRRPHLINPLVIPCDPMP